MLCTDRLRLRLLRPEDAVVLRDPPGSPARPKPGRSPLTVTGPASSPIR